MRASRKARIVNLSTDRWWPRPTGGNL